MCENSMWSTGEKANKITLTALGKLANNKHISLDDFLLIIVKPLIQHRVPTTTANLFPLFCKAGTHSTTTNNYFNVVYIFVQRVIKITEIN